MVVRTNDSRVEGRLSIMNFHYLVGRPGTVEHFVETHAPALYTADEYRSAFEAAGLAADLDPEGLMGRGLWVAQHPANRAVEAREADSSRGPVRARPRLCDCRRLGRCGRSVQLGRRGDAGEHQHRACPDRVRGADVGQQAVADDDRVARVRAGELGGRLEQPRLGLAHDHVRLAAGGHGDGRDDRAGAGLQVILGRGYTGSRLVATKRAPRRTASAAMESRS